MEKISIIVPIYNVENYIVECIESIINQTYKNTEIILVDDGSPDNCGSICDEYAQKDERIIVIHKENGGLSSARNAGLDIASGKYVCFIDSDDYIHKEFIERLYSRIEKDNSDVVQCGYTSDNEELGITSKILEDRSYSSEEIIIKMNNINNYGCYVSVCNKLFRTNLFESVRFPEGKLHEDVFVTYKLFYMSKMISVLNYNLYYCRQTPNSITRSEFSIKRLDVLEGYEYQIDFFKDRNKKLYYSTCLLYGHILKNYYFFTRNSSIEDKTKYEELIIKKGKVNLKNVMKSRGNIMEKMEIYVFNIFPNFYCNVIVKILDIIKGKK